MMVTSSAIGWLDTSSAAQLSWDYSSQYCRLWNDLDGRITLLSWVGMDVLVSGQCLEVTYDYHIYRYLDIGNAFICSTQRSGRLSV